MKYNTTEFLPGYYDLDMPDYSDFSLSCGEFTITYIEVKCPMLSHGAMIIPPVFQLPLE